MKKKIFISSVVMTGLLAVGAIGILPTYAQDTTTYLPIVQKLADRFELEAEDVQDVFEEERAAHHAAMLANFEDRLTGAVSEGKITEEQKQKILDKHEEMQAKMDEWKDLEPEARREAMQAYHEELKTWAEEQEIKFPFMGFKFGGPHHGGMFLEKLD